MWADNETPIDLLGFDYLVDQLEFVLTEPRLRPITVGTLGDWGSGKTSLMYMTARRLKEREGYAVVSFSPWRYESTAEVKAQLMVAVLREIERWIDKIDETETDKRNAARERLGKLVGLLRKLVARSAPVAGGAGAAALGAPPEVGVIVGGIAKEAIEKPGDDAPDRAPADDVETESLPLEATEFASATEFREELKKLMADIDELKALVVLIDDVDRCLPPTIIETFETIRLFLHVPDTAFVIAAHPLIVEAAVAHRYAGNREGDVNLGRDYLEKIVHLPIVVPPLSRHEVESYINLLFCELHLQQEQFEELRTVAAERRATEPLGVAMNYGIAAEVFEGGAVPEELAASFELSNKIGPILGEGLRGNPRQVKRFLNSFRLRLITANKRGAELDPSILAKLMVLELEQDEFQQLFEWQIVQDGDPVELRDAESLVRDDNEPKDMSPEAKSWAARSPVERWLALDPPLAGVPLGTYFFYSRDKLSPVAAGARLSGAQQAILAKLQLRVAAQRRAAVDDAATLGASDRIGVYRSLLGRAARDPSGPAMASALELAGRLADLVPDFGAALQTVPPNAVPPALPLQIMVAFDKDPPPAVATALDAWHKQGNQKIKTAVDAARRAKKA